MENDPAGGRVFVCPAVAAALSSSEKMAACDILHLKICNNMIRLLVRSRKNFPLYLSGIAGFLYCRSLPGGETGEPQTMGREMGR